MSARITINTSSPWVAVDGLGEVGGVGETASDGSSGDKTTNRVTITATVAPTIAHRTQGFIRSSVAQGRDATGSVGSPLRRVAACRLEADGGHLGHPVGVGHLRGPRDGTDHHVARRGVALHRPPAAVRPARVALTGFTSSPTRTVPGRATSAYIPNGNPPRPPILGR